MLNDTLVSYPAWNELAAGRAVIYELENGLFISQLEFWAGLVVARVADSQLGCLSLSQVCDAP